MSHASAPPVHHLCTVHADTSRPSPPAAQAHRAEHGLPADEQLRQQQEHEEVLLYQTISNALFTMGGSSEQNSQILMNSKVR